MRGTGESRTALLLEIGPLGTSVHCRLAGGGILSQGGVLEICISSLGHGLQGEGGRDVLTS